MIIMAHNCPFVGKHLHTLCLCKHIHTSTYKHLHTLCLSKHIHTLRPGTHTHTLVGCGGKKAQRSLGVPGGTGQGMQMIRV